MRNLISALAVTAVVCSLDYAGAAGQEALAGGGRSEVELPATPTSGQAEEHVRHMRAHKKSLIQTESDVAEEKDPVEQNKAATAPVRKAEPQSVKEKKHAKAKPRQVPEKRTAGKALPAPAPSSKPAGLLEELFGVN